MSFSVSNSPILPFPSISGTKPGPSSGKSDAPAPTLPEGAPACLVLFRSRNAMYPNSARIPNPTTAPIPIPALAPAVRPLFPLSLLEAKEEENDDEDEAELETLNKPLLDVASDIKVSLVVVDDSVVFE